MIFSNQDDDIFQGGGGGSSQKSMRRRIALLTPMELKRSAGVVVVEKSGEVQTAQVLTLRSFVLMLYAYTAERLAINSVVLVQIDQLPPMRGVVLDCRKEASSHILHVQGHSYRSFILPNFAGSMPEKSTGTSGGNSQAA